MGECKFALVYAMQAFSGNMFIAPHILNLGSGMACVVHIINRPFYGWDINLVPIV